VESGRDATARAMIRGYVWTVHVCAWSQAGDAPAVGAVLTTKGGTSYSERV